MIESWRWFGDTDPVSLLDARQAGAKAIVSALHHMYDGRRWELNDIEDHRGKIRAAGLEWNVCESIPMHKSVKLRSGPYREYISAWKDSLANLGRAGIKTVCYNFMPVVDWTRTDLHWQLPHQGQALRFDFPEFVAYDVFILERPGAAANYSEAALAAARERLPVLVGDRLVRLENNIIGGLPAREAWYTRDQMRDVLSEFAQMDADQLRENLFEFLREVVPVAEDFGMQLAIHPDDPPISLFGLPRIVSTADDARRLLAAIPSPANGLTLCCGSYGSRPDNNLPAMAKEFAARIYFTHLRNVTHEADGSFYEADHLGGDTDLIAVVRELLVEEQRRRDAGQTDADIPMRPDHGHLLLDDLNKNRINPGYSCIGRLKGLAELRGVMRTFDWIEAQKSASTDTASA